MWCDEGRCLWVSFHVFLCFCSGIGSKVRETLRVSFGPRSDLLRTSFRTSFGPRSKNGFWRNLDIWMLGAATGLVLGAAAGAAAAAARCCSCWCYRWCYTGVFRARRFVASFPLDMTIWKCKFCAAFFHVVKAAFHAVLWCNRTWIMMKFVPRSRWVWLVFHCVCTSLFFCSWNILRFWTAFHAEELWVWLFLALGGRSSMGQRCPGRLLVWLRPCSVFEYTVTGPLYDSTTNATIAY